VIVFFGSQQVLRCKFPGSTIGDYKCRKNEVLRLTFQSPLTAVAKTVMASLPCRKKSDSLPEIRRPYGVEVWAGLFSCRVFPGHEALIFLQATALAPEFFGLRLGREEVNLSNRWTYCCNLKTSKASLCAGHDIPQCLQAAGLADLSGRHF
jgi:hypothetical protein